MSAAQIQRSMSRYNPLVKIQEKKAEKRATPSMEPLIKDVIEEHGRPIPSYMGTAGGALNLIRPLSS